LEEPAIPKMGKKRKKFGRTLWARPPPSCESKKKTPAPVEVPSRKGARTWGGEGGKKKRSQTNQWGVKPQRQERKTRRRKRNTWGATKKFMTTRGTSLTLGSPKEWTATHKIRNLHGRCREQWNLKKGILPRGERIPQAYVNEKGKGGGWSERGTHAGNGMWVKRLGVRKKTNKELRGGPFGRDRIDRD